MSIYFKRDLASKMSVAIKEDRDKIDVCKDICNIEQTIRYLKVPAESISIENYYNVRRHAKELDELLRKKYPTINNLLNVANLFPKRSSATPVCSQAREEILSNLVQDYFGILCDTAWKSGIIASIKEFIDYVD